MHSSFKELKNLHLICLQEIFQNCLYIYVDTLHFVLLILANHQQSLEIKNLTSLPDKFLINISRLDFTNCIMLIKTEFLSFAKVTHFSNPFGITLIST